MHRLGNEDMFLEVYKSWGSELDFKVAWFDLWMIIDSWLVLFDSFYFILCIVQSAALGEKDKYSDSSTAVN